MAVHAGHEGKVKSGSTAVASVTNFQIETSADTVESHAMGSTWKTRIATYKDWNGTIDCHYDTADAGQTAFAIGSTLTFGGYTSGDASGAKYLSGSCVVTGRSVGDPMDDMVSLSITVEGNGELSEATVGA
ncbi:phage tail tube protein [Methylobrevis pamukkalensis]|uniref:Phage major tail protein 2 n=1 Tax=Methylobrevis pamukkalensis TaxID=1439726 RepID=A0A1E3GZT5_9HYPH|nr:hypothetical protein [Methylobrevis pamukkalensis]ODN69552.1 hypothetical protein A6302_03146 [Methylobrevis pamukkalensis]